MVTNILAPACAETGPTPANPLPDWLWAVAQTLLPVRVKPEHPLGCHRRRLPDYVVLKAIMYQLITGCQWKAISSKTHGCSGSVANARYHEWVAAGVFRELWAQALRAAAAFGELDLSWVSMDGCITKAPCCQENAGRNPTDRGKPGVKRSLLTDAGGLPIGLAVGGANTPDISMFLDTWESSLVPIMGSGAGVCLDKGYDAQWVRNAIEIFDCEPHVRARGEEIQALKAGEKARRWVVERTHSWLNGYRALRTRWMRSATGYLNQLQLACAIITWRKVLDIRTTR
jgi:putative transposase